MDSFQECLSVGQWYDNPLASHQESFFQAQIIPDFFVRPDHILCVPSLSQHVISVRNGLDRRDRSSGSLVLTAKTTFYGKNGTFSGCDGQNIATRPLSLLLMNLLPP